MTDKMWADPRGWIYSGEEGNRKLVAWPGYDTYHQYLCAISEDYFVGTFSSAIRRQGQD